MAKDKFGYGTDQLKEAWDYTSDNAPIFYIVYISVWKFVDNYESVLKSGKEGPGEFLMERLDQSFPDLNQGER